MGADTGTTKGVLGDARTAGDRERRGVADGSARVPEVYWPRRNLSIVALGARLYKQDFYSTSRLFPYPLCNTSMPSLASSPALAPVNGGMQPSNAGGFLLPADASATSSAPTTAGLATQFKYVSCRLAVIIRQKDLQKAD